MRKVMFALCFVFGGIVLVNAQDTTSNQYKSEQQSQYPQDQQDRQRIQTSELPDVVKRTLEDQEYRGWLVSGAFKASASEQSMNADSTGVTSDSTSVSGRENGQENNSAVGAQDEEIYIVELKNGAETKSVAFDKDGQKIEGWEDQNQYNQNDQMNQNGQPDQTDQNPNGQTRENQSTDQNSQSTDQNSQSTEQNSQRDQQSTTSPDQSGQSSSGDLNKDQH